MSEKRFKFGKNWKAFSRTLNEDKINSSMKNIQRLLKLDDLKGLSFLDVGSGSGLSSLAAIRLGAEVRAFDYDMDSVEASDANLTKFLPEKKWLVTQGSALEEEFMAPLGQYDIVYSWGVLHHTGNMWQGIDLAAKAVKPGGKFAIAIYNDQGGASRRWHSVKKLYVKSPRILQFIMALTFFLFFEVRSSLIKLIRFQNPLSIENWRQRSENRGMSVWFDVVDWVGGYPFEVAKPEEIFNFLYERGFSLNGMNTCAGGHGCNEFLFLNDKK